MGPSRITWFQREADFHQRLNPTPFPGSKCPTLLAPLNLSKSCFAGAPGDQPGGAALCPGRHHWRGAEEHEAFPPFSPTATCLANRIAEYCPSGLNHVRKRVFLLIVLSPFLDQISAVAGAASVWRTSKASVSSPERPPGPARTFLPLASPEREWSSAAT